MDARPLLSVTTDVVDSVARAPEPGAANVTVTPGTGVPLASVTSTASGVANAVETAVCCGEPVDTAVALAAPTKLAVTFCAPAIVTVQVVAVPEHAPPQPRNVAPATGAAVRTT